MVDFIDSNFSDEDIKKIKTYTSIIVPVHHHSLYKNKKWLECNMNSKQIITYHKIKKMLNNG